MASIRMQTNRLKKGMVIRSDVYTNNGVVIVPEGTVVTKEVYELLTRHFVDDVVVEYIPENKIKSKNTAGMASEKQRKVNEFIKQFHIAEELLSQNLMEMIQQDKKLDISTLLSTVQSVVNNAGDDIELCDMLLSMKMSSENLYAHSIHVALYARLLAGWMNFAPEETELVVLAGLLHDIGHVNGAEQSICLHEELEKSCNEKHPHLGYKLVANKLLDHRVKQAILTHHERMDGSGFPMGVTYSNINHVTRILAIADTYATLSVEEPGYPAMTPFEILNYCTSEIGKFDSGYLLAFMEHIAQNFIRHMVRLNDGQIGTIVMLNKMALTKPLVQVGERFVDLAIQKELEIIEFLD